MHLAKSTYTSGFKHANHFVLQNDYYPYFKFSIVKKKKSPKISTVVKLSQVASKCLMLVVEHCGCK